ncbi:hypothetical protein [Streptomyces chilikensis]|uniref:Uncharacterized protein n=1 Tax=Streptomyces chilikensis TaxID=1194079 RepID=A0ABV3ERC7_9ACTN
MTDQPTTADLLNDLGALHTRTRVSPLPQNPEVFGWQAQAGALAAGFARALHALHQVAPEQAQQLAVWWEGPFGEGPDSYRHTMWLERHVGGGDRAVTDRWVAEGRAAAEAANRTAEQSHSCGNCEGVDPQSCLTNPERVS